MAEKFPFLIPPWIKEEISFLFTPQLQEKLFPVKVVFIFFSAVFFIGIIYFLIKSSYLKVQFWQDLVEFFGWKSYGFIGIERKWAKIQKRIVIGSESEYKIAIIEADNLLRSNLEKRGYSGKTFKEMIEKVEKEGIFSPQEILKAHQVRNSIVYDPDYELDLEEAKKILKVYKEAILNLESF